MLRPWDFAMVLHSAQLLGTLWKISQSSSRRLKLKLLFPFSFLFLVLASLTNKGMSWLYFTLAFMIYYPHCDLIRSLRASSPPRSFTKG